MLFALSMLCFGIQPRWLFCWSYLLSSLAQTPTFRFLYTVLQQTSLDDYFADNHHHYQEPTLMINSISGTLNPFSASAILRLRHLPRFSETELEHSFWCLFFGFRFGMHCGPDYTLSPMCSKKGSWGFLSPHRKNLTLVKNLLKLRHESGDLNSSSHYHVKLICCLLTLVGSTLILLHTGMEWPFKGNQNKRFVAYYVSGENGNISRMFLSKTDWRYHGEKVVFDHSCCEASKALSVLCGDSSLIFIFYSVAISTEILAHYSCFMEKNEKSRSGLNFINSIKDLPQQNIWK